MSKDNKASRIIVSSMTLIEVGDFLKETVFSSDAISKLEERVDKKNKDYEKAYKVWLYNHDENEFCKIFNPIRYKGKNSETLTMVPFWIKGDKEISFVLFSIFHYNGQKYVASCIDGGLEFYSNHCLERYAERCLDDKDAVIDEEFIGDMLIYNLISQVRIFEYKGRKSTYNIVQDGVFISVQLGHYRLMKTFLGTDNFFKNQKEFYNDELESLNRHLIENGLPSITPAA